MNEWLIDWLIDKIGLIVGLNVKEYALQQKFSEVSVGLCEEMGFQPSPKLSTTDGRWAKMWWKRVPDGWGCNKETPSTKLCSCRRDKHVMAFSRTKMCPARDASDWDADVVKVGRTVLTDTVRRRDCYFKLYSLWHWEPMKHVAKRLHRKCLNNAHSQELFQ